MAKTIRWNNPVRRKGELGPVAMYKAYKRKHKTKLKGTTFTAILENFNSRLLQLLLDGVTVKLPFHCGSLFVCKKKVNYEHLSLDYGHWRKTGERLFHTNRHSDGYVAHFHWLKYSAIFVHKSLYELTFSRAACRRLAAIMKQPAAHRRYPEQIYYKRHAKTPR